MGAISLLRSTAVVVAVAFGALAPAVAAAQTTQANPDSGRWHYAAAVYGYMPSIGGTAGFPADSNGTPIQISFEQILEHLEFAAMGAFEAHNGRWGLFTDVLHLSVGTSKSNSRDFSLGDTGIPAGASADLDWALKGWIWTLAGEFRVASEAAFKVDMLAGLRLFDLKQRLRWSIAGDLGPIAAPGRSGQAEIGAALWDGIVGAKGRYTFGARREWAVPFYLDIGTGQSDRTWQAMIGISHAFSWGELSGHWRSLSYDMKPGSATGDMNFNGPMIGASFRW